MLHECVMLQVVNVCYISFYVLINHVRRREAYAWSRGELETLFGEVVGLSHQRLSTQSEQRCVKTMSQRL